MECSHCGSQNVKTFGMAYASQDVGVGSWHPAVKFLLLGPLGLLVRHGRNSVVGITAPPEKPFPLRGRPSPSCFSRRGYGSSPFI